jgi:hypothetical protein
MLQEKSNIKYWGETPVPWRNTDKFDYFHQQMHQDQFVTVLFIERVPQYAFRQLYCHHQGVLLSEMLHRPILKLRHNSESIYVITTS